MKIQKEFNSPLAFFGSRPYDLIKSVLTAFPEGPIERFIDPFCGSGSFSFTMMLNDYAKTYVMNDKSEVMQGLWKNVKKNPEHTIEIYKNLLDNFLNKSKEEKTKFYSEIIEKFNTTSNIKEKALLYPFLINTSEGGQRFDENNLFNANPKVESEEGIISNKDFSERIELASKLLNENNVIISCKDFSECLQDATKNDAVIFDIPYSGDYAESLYEKFQKHDILRQNVSIEAGKLLGKSVPFVIPYEVLYFMNTEFPIKPFKDLEHYVRYESLHGGYLECLYTPDYSKPSDPSFVLYADLMTQRPHSNNLIDAYFKVLSEKPKTTINLEDEVELKGTIDKDNKSKSI